MLKTKKEHTIASLPEAEFSRLCQCAQLLDIQIRDMGSGYSLVNVKTGKRIGFLTLDTPANEVFRWIEWANLVPDYPTS